MDTPTKQFVKEVLTGKNQFTFSFGTDCLYAINIKRGYPFLKEVDKFALTNAIYHLEDGYDRFFKHLSRFPKYKCKHKAKKSYTTNITNGNIEISDNSMFQQKIFS